jgi:hypothetical protein
METKQKIWNIIFSIIFLILGYSIIIQISQEQILTLTLTESILMVLATQRLIRLVSYDKIMAFFRELFSYKDKTGFCECISTLISCPWCFGIWAALLIIVIKFLVPFGEVIILLLSIATLASILQISVNFIGWSAEHKKQQTQNFKK